MSDSYGEIRREMDDAAEHTQAWNDLFKAARKCRDLLLTDNGGTRAVDPDDEWLAKKIWEMDELIGHNDPNATPEEVALATDADLEAAKSEALRNPPAWQKQYYGSTRHTRPE